MTIFTLGLVVVGLLQVIVLGFQLCILYRQTAIINGSLRVAQRSLVKLREYTALTARIAQSSEATGKAARVSARATRKAADAAVESNLLTERALRLTERADVLIDGVEVSTPGRGAGNQILMPSTTFTLRFKNAGRTRAVRVKPTFWMGVPDGEQSGTPACPVTMLGPSDLLRLSFPAISTFVGKDTFPKIVDGGVPFKFEGTLLYEDVFETQHRTECTGTLIPGSCEFRVDRNEAG